VVLVGCLVNSGGNWAKAQGDEMRTVTIPTSFVMFIYAFLSILFHKHSQLRITRNLHLF